MFDSKVVADLLVAGWEEDNPAAADVKFGVDEFDPKSPAVQILAANTNTKKTFIADDVYRIVQTVRIMVYLQPIRYADAGLVESKLTFYNVLDEIDRIIEAARVAVAVTKFESAGWNNIIIPKGFGAQPEPLAFTAIQDITVEQYGVETVSAVLTGRIISITAGEGTIDNCRSVRWRTVHTISPRLLPSSKIPIGWLQSHSWIEGELGVMGLLPVAVIAHVPAVADATIITPFIIVSEGTDGTDVTYTFTGLIIASMDKSLEGSEPVYVYKFLAYSVTEV